MILQKNYNEFRSSLNKNYNILSVVYYRNYNEITMKTRGYFCEKLYVVLISDPRYNFDKRPTLN